MLCKAGSTEQSRFKENNILTNHHKFSPTSQYFKVLPPLGRGEEQNEKYIAGFNILFISNFEMGNVEPLDTYRSITCIFFLCKAGSTGQSRFEKNDNYRLWYSWQKCIDKYAKNRP